MKEDDLFPELGWQKRLLYSKDPHATRRAAFNPGPAPFQSPRPQPYSFC